MTYNQHLIETWSATRRAQANDLWQLDKIVLRRVSKPKANTEHLLCVSP